MFFGGGVQAPVFDHRVCRAATLALSPVDLYPPEHYDYVTGMTGKLAFKKVSGFGLGVSVWGASTASAQSCFPACQERAWAVLK